MVRTTSPDHVLADKVAVVVGGGRGMGRATAKKLAAAGAHVTVTARTPADLETAVAEIQQDGGQAVAYVMDITQADDITGLANEVRQRSGHVDVLVNSAGMSLIAPLDETSEAQWDAVLDTNLKGPYMVIRAMLDLLRASEGADIVNVASKVALSGHGLVSAYVAAKAGLIGFGRSLAQELGPEGIRVTTVCPGPVDTPMRWAATPNLDPRLTISADTVADTILFLLALDGRTTTGNEIVIEAMGYDESTVPLD